MRSIPLKVGNNNDAYRFNQNASLILIGMGDKAIIDLFASLNYECVVMESGKKFQLQCPICHEANAMIMAGGDVYPLFWKCLGPRCPSKQDRSFKNLVGLVRACTESQSLGLAYKVIAKSLGYSNPFSVTNMTEAQVAEVINGEIPDIDHVFLVADLEIKRRLAQVKYFAAFFGGDDKAAYLKRKIIIVLLPENGEAIAERLKDGSNVVASHDPSIFKGVHGYDLEQLVRSVIRRAARAATSDQN